MHRFKKTRIFGLIVLIGLAIVTPLLWQSGNKTPVIVNSSKNLYVVAEKPVENISKTTELNSTTPAQSKDFPLPDILPVLMEQNPTVRELIDEDRHDLTSYILVDSVEELIKIVEKWRSFRTYEGGRFSRTNDLKASARRLMLTKGKTQPIIYWYLGILLEDTSLYSEAAYLYRNLINDTDIQADESLRMKAKFHLAMLEFAKPNSKWSDKSDESITEPGRTATEVAGELFKQISKSEANIKTDFGADVRDIAHIFTKAAKRKGNREPDEVTLLQSSLIVAREIYNSNLSSEWGHTLKNSIELSRSESFRKYMLQASEEDRMVWATYVTWMLYEKHKYNDVIEQITPLLQAGLWPNRQAYLHAQYFLASSHRKNGDIKAAKKITEQVVSEGFKFDDMPAAISAFFVDTYEK